MDRTDSDVPIRTPGQRDLLTNLHKEDVSLNDMRDLQQRVGSPLQSEASEEGTSEDLQGMLGT